MTSSPSSSARKWRSVSKLACSDCLSAAFRAGRLADALARYVAPDVLVVDEVGYLTYGTDAANMLYHVVNERHRLRRSMVFTSNQHPDAWGAVLHDDDLAQAIVDRVLERGRLHRPRPGSRRDREVLSPLARASLRKPGATAGWLCSVSKPSCSTQSRTSRQLV